MTALDVASVKLAPVWFTPESPLIIRGRVPGAVVASRVQVDRVKVTARWEPPTKHRAGGWVTDVWLGRVTGDPARPYDTIYHDSRDASTAARLAKLIVEHTTPGPLLKVLGELNHGRFAVKGSGCKHPFSAEELRAIAKLVNNYQCHAFARTSGTEQTR